MESARFLDKPRPFRMVVEMKRTIDDFTALPVTRQRRWQLRRVRDGKCMICGGPLANATHCELHRVAHAASQRKRYALAKAGV